MDEIKVTRGRPELTVHDGPGKGVWLKLSWLVEQACTATAAIPTCMTGR